MARQMSKLQKLAWIFSGLFVFVYSLDYVPGIMHENGKMFGLFSMTPLVDAGHLALGALAVICALISKKAARFAKEDDTNEPRFLRSRKRGIFSDAFCPSKCPTSAVATFKRRGSLRKMSVATTLMPYG